MTCELYDTAACGCGLLNGQPFGCGGREGKCAGRDLEVVRRAWEGVPAEDLPGRLAWAVGDSARAVGSPAEGVASQGEDRGRGR